MTSDNKRGPVVIVVTDFGCFQRTGDVVRRRLVWKRKGRGGSKILRAKVGGTIWKREMGHLLL